MSENEQDGRVRWGKWLGWIVVILIVAALIAHSIWGSITASRLQRLVQAAKDKGEPVLPADFAYTNISAPDNAALDVLAAMESIDERSPARQEYYRLRSDIGLPLRDNERKLIDDLIVEFPPTFAYVAKAEGKTRFALDLDLTSPMMGKLLPDLNKVRTLADYLRVQAYHDFDKGRHDAAIDRLIQIRTVSRYVDHHITIIGHLVAIGVEGLRASAAEEVAADLKMGTGEGMARPEQVKRLIDSLLDERELEAGLLRSLLGERMAQLDAMTSLAAGVPMPGGPAWHPLARYAAKPIIHRNAMSMFQGMTTMIEGSDAKNLAAFRAKVPPLARSSSLLDFLSNMYLPSLDRFMTNHYRILTDRRLAAVALAMRWYATEHEGKLPATLGELVPKYLPAVPLDPLAAGKPLKYLPHASTPLIYSIGEDMSDDGGSETPINPRRQDPGEWELKDRVSPLYRRPRPEPIVWEDEAPASGPATQEAAVSPAG